MFKSSLRSKIITSLSILLLLLVIGAVNFKVTQISAQEKIFTMDELAKNDGLDGHKAYYAFEGVVYDVTDSPLWKLGKHFEHQAGEDLTGMLEGAPHGDAIVRAFPVVGKMEASAVEEVGVIKEEVVVAQSATSSDAKWYSNRFRFLGFSILGWTGVVLAVFFLFTFASCFAMPWANLPLPWKGQKIGPDPLDNASRRMPWSSMHKHFVWITVIFGIIHGVIGFMQMLLGMYL